MNCNVWFKHLSSRMSNHGLSYARCDIVTSAVRTHENTNSLVLTITSTAFILNVHDRLASIRLRTELMGLKVPLALHCTRRRGLCLRLSLSHRHRSSDLFRQDEEKQKKKKTILNNRCVIISLTFQFNGTLKCCFHIHFFIIFIRFTLERNVPENVRYPLSGWPVSARVPVHDQTLHTGLVDRRSFVRPCSAIRKLHLEPCPIFRFFFRQFCLLSIVAVRFLRMPHTKAKDRLQRVFFFLIAYGNSWSEIGVLKKEVESKIPFNGIIYCYMHDIIFHVWLFSVVFFDCQWFYFVYFLFAAAQCMLKCKFFIRLLSEPIGNSNEVNFIRNTVFGIKRMHGEKTEIDREREKEIEAI